MYIRTIGWSLLFIYCLMYNRTIGWSLFLSADHKYVAIDDIRFENCSYPRPSGSCKPKQVKCDDGACIYLSQVYKFHNYRW